MKLLISLKPSTSTWLSKVVLVIGLLITFDVSAEQPTLDAKAYLSNIIDAQQSQSFTGVFNYGRPGYQVEHYVYQQITKDGKAKEWIRLSSKDEGFVLVDRQVVCVTKGYKSKFRPNTILQSLVKADIDNLLQDYNVTLLPQEIKVGNRTAQQLLFTSRDGYRYTYKMAFDKATFFPLEYIFLDSKNQILESGQFSQFNPVANDKVMAKPFTGCMKINRVEPKVNKSDWSVTWKPVGFDLVHVVVNKQTKDEQLVYSDGLVFFSIFIEQLTDPRMSDIERHFGATAVVSRKINLSSHEKYLITVVGEIPFSTAERIALSAQKK